MDRPSRLAVTRRKRDRRFSRFRPPPSLNRVNATPLGVTLVSEDFASMLTLALGAASASGGRFTPAAGGAIIAAGHDRDFADLPLDGDAVEPAAIHSVASIALRGEGCISSAVAVLALAFVPQ
jgi:thiamine biosynthesis lipoprotein ApbE